MFERQRDFELFVVDHLYDHPEWLGGTIEAIHSAIALKLKDTQSKQADADTALLICYQKIKSLPKADKEMVLKAIKNGQFKGSPYVEKLK